MHQLEVHILIGDWYSIPYTESNPFKSLSLAGCKRACMGLQQSSGLVCQSSAARILRPCFGCIVGCSSPCALFYGCCCTGQLAMRQAVLHAGQCFVHSCRFLTRLSSHSLMYLQDICTLKTPSESIWYESAQLHHFYSMPWLYSGRTLCFSSYL